MQMHNAMIVAEVAGSLAAIRATVDVYSNLELSDAQTALTRIRAEAVGALEKLNGQLGKGSSDVSH